MAQGAKAVQEGQVAPEDLEDLEVQADQRPLFLVNQPDQQGLLANQDFPEVLADWVVQADRKDQADPVDQEAQAALEGPEDL